MEFDPESLILGFCVGVVLTLIVLAIVAGGTPPVDDEESP